MIEKNQNGFTLVELIVVVAIIGILAAISIPSYLNYLDKPKLAEAKLLLDGLKSPILDFYDRTGSIPDLQADFGDSIQSQGTYVGSIVTSGVNPPTFEATFINTGISTQLSGQTVVLTFSTSAKFFAIRCTNISSAITGGAC